MGTQGVGQAVEGIHRRCEHIKGHTHEEQRRADERFLYRYGSSNGGGHLRAHANAHRVHRALSAKTARLLGWISRIRIHIEFPPRCRTPQLTSLRYGPTGVNGRNPDGAA